jgi:hypothetical protein
MPTPNPNAKPRRASTEPTEEQKQMARDAETDRLQRAAAKSAPTTKTTMGKRFAKGGGVRGGGCASKGVGRGMMR